uniref:Uncharacterized protein n=1 Tax=Rhodnius prolixus TaxID=13249 RepID=T1HPH9_RHOPR
MELPPKSVVQRIAAYVGSLLIHLAQALIHKRAFTESEVREDLLLVIIIAACENNLSDGTEVAQTPKISFAILDKFLKEFSSVFHHSKMSTSTGAWSNLV